MDSASVVIKLLPLTAIQARVHELDKEQVRVSEIARLTGLSIARVSNVKARLRTLGYQVTKWKRNSSEMPAKAPRPAKVAKPRPICKCGLSLPCNSCLDVLGKSLTEPHGHHIEAFSQGGNRPGLRMYNIHQTAEIMNHPGR